MALDSDAGESSECGNRGSHLVSGSSVSFVGWIKECDPNCYPNIRVLIQLACTLPVSSCQCERSASALRRLNSYMRASMGKQRLANLALIHIHYDKEISLEEVVDKYAQLHPRRIELDSLIKS